MRKRLELACVEFFFASESEHVSKIGHISESRKIALNTSFAQKFIASFSCPLRHLLPSRLSFFSQR